MAGLAGVHCSGIIGELWSGTLAYFRRNIYCTLFRWHRHITLYDFDEEGNQFPILALIKKDKSDKWSIIYSQMMALFHLEYSQQFLDLTLRPTKAPLFARSMMLMELKIIFRNLNVLVLILDLVSEQDPMPFEKENQELKNQHPDYTDYIVYKDTGHNIHYEHPTLYS